MIGLFIAIILVKMLLGKDYNRVRIKKMINLLLICAVNTLIMVAYLYLNVINSGFATGRQRMAAPESFVELSTQLLIAQLAELLNITFFLNPTFVTAFLIVIGIYIVISLKKTRRFLKTITSGLTYTDYNVFFIMTGCTYWSAIVVLRFLNYFDPFNYRLLFPASILIMIGLIDLLLTRYEDLVKEKCNSMRASIVVLVCIFILLSFTASSSAKYLYSVLVDGNAPNVYEQIRVETIKKYNDIPPGSIVVYGDHYINFLRPDLIHTAIRSGPSFEKETIEDFFSRAALLSDGKIYLEVPKVKDGLEAWREYDPSVHEYIEQYRSIEDEFVIINPD